MVALESTNQVPLTLDVRQRWANERQYTGIDLTASGSQYAFHSAEPSCSGSSTFPFGKKVPPIQTNAYWDPEAVKIVFDSDIEIDMVALESTNQVPLTLESPCYQYKQSLKHPIKSK
jgi:inosine-uridine nucleoside N-ribohydrolase